MLFFFTEKSNVTSFLRVVFKKHARKLVRKKVKNLLLTTVKHALGGALMMKYLPATMPTPLVILLVILGSVIIGMIFSLFLGVAVIHFNQIK